MPATPDCKVAAAVMVYGRDNESCVCFPNSSAINSEIASPAWLGQDSGSDSVWSGAPAILKSNLSFGRPEDRLNPVPAQSVKEGLPLGDGAALDGRSVLTPNLIELARCRRLDSFDLD